MTEDLLTHADRMLRDDTSRTGGWWPRTVTFLLRGALEEDLTAFWIRTRPGTERASMRAQMHVLLEEDPPGTEVGRDAAAAWNALSRACHHHAYELAPTAAELRTWHTTVLGIRTALRDAGAAARPAPSPN
jgi:hypothetical protein